jgi:hypothetical protein
LNDMGNYRNTPSVLAALEPLPEVVETNTDSSWMLFHSLQSQAAELYAPTQPAELASAAAGAAPGEPLSVQDVMTEARRHNRIAPQEPHWGRLCDLLQKATGSQPPPPMTPHEAAGTPPLAKRIRVRDQVEWAEKHGQLPTVLGFFRSLPEDQWMHIGR